MDYLMLYPLKQSYLLIYYMNGLSSALSSKAKLFADNISLFNVTRGINTLANELNSDLKKVVN